MTSFNFLHIAVGSTNEKGFGLCHP